MIDKIIEHVMQQGLSLSLLVVAVAHLKGKIAECEKDRHALWERLLKMTQRHDL